MSALPVESHPDPKLGSGSEMVRSTDWIVPVPPRAVAELDAALRSLERRGLSWPHFGREDFPLPTFSRDLSAVLEEIENGRGFALLRGFPVDRYTSEELQNLYWGIGAHLGRARYQNATGELIGVVRDEYRLYGDVQEAPADLSLGRSSRSKARSSGPLRFHTDRCDVVTLLCVRQARAGGLSRIVSAVSVANAIRARRPDLHALLCQDYWRSRQGEEAGGERQVYALPLFATHRGQVHHAVLAHLRGSGAEAARRPAAHRGSERGARSPRRGLRGAGLHHGAQARRSPAPQQPRRLSRAHGVRGRERAGPRSAPPAPVARPYQ